MYLAGSFAGLSRNRHNYLMRQPERQTTGLNAGVCRDFSRNINAVGLAREFWNPEPKRQPAEDFSLGLPLPAAIPYQEC